MTERKVAIAVHGGAGAISRNELTAAQEALYRQGLAEAVDKGYRLLASGGSALDAVTAALSVLEDDPLFNAGRGAVFNHQGGHELDASIMCGRTLRAGAVTCVRHVRNPIQLARAVMERSQHVFLCADGAEEFALEMGLEIMPVSYFFTPLRYQQWMALRDSHIVSLDHTEPEKLGTAGVVALDRQGNLAAGTSTGGMTNKRYMRIGDTPVIGAGTYANNHTCAISCTGHGEYFLRSVVAYDISCLMEYKGMSLQQAAETVVLGKLRELGGEGGIIGIDAQGTVALVFNSEGMYRGYRQEGGDTITGIYS